MLIPGAKVFQCFNKMVRESSCQWANLEKMLAKGLCGGSLSNSPKRMSYNLSSKEDWHRDDADQPLGWYSF